MSWTAALLALLVSHVVGDVLLQTESQAVNKEGGLRDAAGRRSLRHHVFTYTLAFIPALVWIAGQTSISCAAAVAAVVAVTHVLIDDGRIVRLWLRTVKRSTQPGQALAIAVDQTFHVLCLFGAALITAG